MTIREAIDAIVTHSRSTVCHSERSQLTDAAGLIFAKASVRLRRKSGVGKKPARSVAVDRTFAKASVRLRRKSGAGQSVARRIGG